MRSQQIKEAGYYCTEDESIIFYAWNNTLEDKDKYPLLVSTYHFEQVLPSGLKCWEDWTGTDTIPQNLDDYEVFKSNKKYKIDDCGTSVNCYIIEDRLTFQQKLSKINEICESNLQGQKLKQSIKQVLEG